MLQNVFIVSAWLKWWKKKAVCSFGQIRRSCSCRVAQLQAGLFLANLFTNYLVCNVIGQPEKWAEGEVYRPLLWRRQTSLPLLCLCPRMRTVVRLTEPATTLAWHKATAVIRLALRHVHSCSRKILFVFVFVHCVQSGSNHIWVGVTLMRKQTIKYAPKQTTK